MNLIFRIRQVRHFRRFQSTGFAVALAVLLLAAPTVMAQNPDLSVSISDSPDPVNAGQLITYLINVSNLGGGSAANVVVELPTPANTVLVQFEVLSGVGWSTVSTLSEVQFTKTTVIAAETAQFRVRAKVLNSTSAGTIITGTSTVATTSSDSNLSNNSATATTTVSTAADLAVNISDAPDPVDPGNNIVYSYTVANFGPSDASTVVVTLPVPVNTTFVQAVGPIDGTWTLGAPPAGGTGNVTFSKSVVAFQEGGIFSLTVNVNGGASGVINAQLSVTSVTTEASPGDETEAETTTVTGGLPCALHVLKPNGGQVWTIGEKRPLRWDSTGLCCDFVRIQLWQNGQKVKGIKKNTPNDGKARWRIKSPKFSPGTNYKVRIFCPGDNASQDFSDGTFTLVAP
jgi:uncharacterized repeat protein (TIGR01451 family)